MSAARQPCCSAELALGFSSSHDHVIDGEHRADVQTRPLRPAPAREFSDRVPDGGHRWPRVASAMTMSPRRNPVQSAGQPGRNDPSRLMAQQAARFGGAPGSRAAHAAAHDGHRAAGNHAGAGDEAASASSEGRDKRSSSGPDSIDRANTSPTSTRANGSGCSSRFVEPGGPARRAQTPCRGVVAETSAAPGLARSLPRFRTGSCLETTSPEFVSTLTPAQSRLKTGSSINCRGGVAGPCSACGESRIRQRGKLLDVGQRLALSRPEQHQPGRVQQAAERAETLRHGRRLVAAMHHAVAALGVAAGVAVAASNRSSSNSSATWRQ